MSGAVERINARLDVQGAVLQEIIRALAPAQAAQVADALRARLGAVASTGALTPAADEATSAELAQVLRALERASPAR